MQLKLHCNETWILIDTHNVSIRKFMFDLHATLKFYHFYAGSAKFYRGLRINIKLLPFWKNSLYFI